MTKKILIIFAAALVMARKAAAQSVSQAPESQHVESNDSQYQLAKFVGDVSLYLSKKLVYPVSAQKQGHEGRVYIQFIVHTDGSIDNIRVVRSSGFSELDEEAIQVAKTMNPTHGSKMWIPAKNNGQAINSYFSLPITFSLD